MSREARKALVTLKSDVKSHMAANPVFRSDFLEWIDGIRKPLLEALVLENNEITRGKIQMLDKLEEDLQIGD